LAADLNLQNFGDSSVATATTCHALAKAFTLVGDLQSAVNAERLAYKAFSDLVGEEDQRTKDSKEWLHELTASAVQLAKLDKLSHTQKQLLLRQKAATQKPLATRATQYSTSGHKSGGSRGKVITGSKGHLPIDDLIDYIHGGSSASTAPSPLSSSKKAKFIKGRNGK
ncbi:Intracellular distribution of mitochondria, partial [Spiromyces aspiralis]